MSDEKAKPAREPSTYVVQERQVDTDDAWVDIATVTVPARTPRKKVIGLALAESGLKPAVESGPLRLRVLDAASARETPVRAVQPELEWKVGEQ